MLIYLYNDDRGPGQPPPPETTEEEKEEKEEERKNYTYVSEKAKERRMVCVGASVT